MSLQLAKRMGLDPAATGSMRRGLKSVASPVYIVDLELPEPLGVLRNHEIFGRDDLPDPDDGFDVVIGMDVWKTCAFFIDGPGRQFGVMR